LRGAHAKEDRFAHIRLTSLSIRFGDQMDASESAVVAARIEAARDEDDLDSEDETYLDNEEIAHRQNMKDQDLLYEEDVLRNPYSLKGWWRYIQAKKEAKPSARNVLFERAVKELPGSYKLWYSYLTDRVKQCQGLCPIDPKVESLNNAFERALVFLHKMPKIWIEYLTWRMASPDVTVCRRTFDRALRALPITQHEQIWPLYLKWAKGCAVKETTIKIYRRYLKLEPTRVEEFIDWLVEKGELDEAAKRLALAVNDDSFESMKGKSKHEMWFDLTDLIAKNPDKVKGQRVEAIIRQGLRKFKAEVGRLWCSLADFFIRLGHFEKARDVYEEAMDTVVTARDFSMIFDAFSQFEESMVTAKMEMEADEEDEESDEEEEGDDVELDLRLARLENLMDRRPELLSSVKLRQNPNDVNEWRKRVSLFKEDPLKTIQTFTTAVKTIDPKNADGSLAGLWIAFAKFYVDHNDEANARVIFEKACQVDYKKVEDLASVWCAWIETEVCRENYPKALDLCKRCTNEPSAKRKRNTDASPDSVQKKLYKSTRLWALFADLEESLGTFATTKAVYDRILELKIATPQLVINYASFLEERNYFEESFKAFEKGIAAFNFPYSKDLWSIYLEKFTKRYGGGKLERARDLFEQVLEHCPAENAKVFFLMYARLEEDYGLARHAMHVYDRASKALPANQKYDIYQIYINRATDFFGLPKTREIYEAAVASLPDQQSAEMCQRFADVEVKLGEVDRAREILAHGSQFCDPRKAKEFWEKWHQFEVHHGNEDTFREMLRIKRSVQIQYTQISFSGHDMAAAAAAAAALPQDNDPKTAMSELEAQAEAKEEPVEEVQANPDEIDIDIDDDDDDDDDVVASKEGMDVEKKDVPAAVFGALADQAKTLSEKSAEPMGALERLKGVKREADQKLNRLKAEAEKEQKAKRATGWRDQV